MIKAESITRTELQKVAGEVQAVRGGSVSLSETIDFLIEVYRNSKRLQNVIDEFPIEVFDPTTEEQDEALQEWFNELKSIFSVQKDAEAKQ